ncbi:MAG TPA: response regulator [Anaerolineales bacterium]|nr:response regulator [Anaerolineae bacterium]HIQ00791.1 response regulator [Anaerolineales bacterium]
MDSPIALIVEDERDLADIFAMALRSAGFEVETVQSGNAALARLDEIAPDLVVLDLHLPGVGGATILRHIREDARLAATRVIVATADDRTAELLQDQADLVLIKPVSLNQLRDLSTRLGSTTSPNRDEGAGDNAPRAEA